MLIYDGNMHKKIGAISQSKSRFPINVVDIRTDGGTFALLLIIKYLFSDNSPLNKIFFLQSIHINMNSLECQLLLLLVQLLADFLLLPLLNKDDNIH